MESMAPNGHPARGRDGAAFGGDGGAGGAGPGASLPALPVTWRPDRTRKVIYAVAAILTVSMTAIAATLPSDGGESWSLGARIGVAAIGFGGALALLVLARPKVVAVNLRSGDAWALLDLDDGTTLSVMGIKPTDGITAARTAVAELRALVDYYSYR
jgi:hypothetical protein